MTIKELMDLVGDNVPQLSKMARGQDSVFFLGNTRAGKSTVVACLSGKPLTVVSVQYGERIIYLLQNEVEASPVIGIGARSVTTIPSLWDPDPSLNIVGAKLWDMPGFADNRGDDRDILNAFCIKEVLSSVRSAKFVLVSNISDLDNDNVSRFTDLLSRVCELFGSSLDGNILASMSIIFTKGAVELNAEYIQSLLDRDILHSGLVLSEKAVSIARHFLQHPELIGFFSLSTGEIPPLGSMISAINSNVQSVSHEVLCSLNIPISPRSALYLMKERDVFLSIDDFKKLCKVYDSQLQISEQLPIVKAAVGQTKQFLASGKSLYEVTVTLTHSTVISFKAKCIEFINMHRIEGAPDLVLFFKQQIKQAVKVIDYKIEICEIKASHMSLKVQLEAALKTQLELREDVARKTQEYEASQTHREQLDGLCHEKALEIVAIEGERIIARNAIRDAEREFEAVERDVKAKVQNLWISGKREINEAVDELAKICTIEGCVQLNTDTSILALVAKFTGGPVIGTVLYYSGALSFFLNHGVKLIFDFSGPIVGAGAVIVYSKISKHNKHLIEASRKVVEKYHTDPKLLVTTEQQIEELKLTLLISHDVLCRTKLQLLAVEKELEEVQKKEANLLHQRDSLENISDGSLIFAQEDLTQCSIIVHEKRSCIAKVQARTLTLESMLGLLEDREGVGAHLGGEGAGYDADIWA